MDDHGHDFHPNRLLVGLEPHVRVRFEDKLRRTDVAKGEVLQRQGDAVEAVYFPEGALIGLQSATPAGDSVQTAMVGWDGALGAFEACGSRVSAFHAEVQAPGSVWRMTAGAYREMYEASANLRTNIHKYVEVLLAEARQNVACNALHSVESRLSRAVLEALERSRDGRALPITQEALAEMLGVQRTTVSACVAALQRAGIVQGRRGALHVMDGEALERLACCCRETVQMARQEIYASGHEACDQ